MLLFCVRIIVMWLCVVVALCFVEFFSAIIYVCVVCALRRALIEYGSVLYAHSCYVDVLLFRQI